VTLTSGQTICLPDSRCRALPTTYHYPDSVSSYVPVLPSNAGLGRYEESVTDDLESTGRTESFGPDAFLKQFASGCNQDSPFLKEIDSGCKQDPERFAKRFDIQMTKLSFLELCYVAQSVLLFRRSAHADRFPDLIRILEAVVSNAVSRRLRDSIPAVEIVACLVDGLLIGWPADMCHKFLLMLEANRHGGDTSFREAISERLSQYQVSDLLRIIVRLFPLVRRNPELNRAETVLYFGEWLGRCVSARIGDGSTLPAPEAVSLLIEGLAWGVPARVSEELCRQVNASRSENPHAVDEMMANALARYEEGQLKTISVMISSLIRT